MTENIVGGPAGRQGDPPPELFVAGHRFVLRHVLVEEQTVLLNGRASRSIVVTILGPDADMISRVLAERAKGAL